MLWMASLASADAQLADYLQSYERYTVVMQEGNHAEAAEYAGLAYQQALPVLGDQSEELIQLHLNYGQALLYAQKKVAAKEQLSVALRRAQNRYGKESAATIEPLLMLGSAKSEWGVNLPGEFRRAERIAKESYVNAPAKMAGLRSLIGQQYANIGNPRQAISYLQKAQQAYRQLHGETHPLVGRAAFWIGKAELALGNKESAREQFLVTTESDPRSAPLAHAFLVRVFGELGQSDRATKHCQAIGASRPFNPNQEQVPLYIVPPEYPSSAQRRGQEGEVVVSYTLDEGGFVKDAEVIKTSGAKRFNTAALDALQKWRFAPRYEEGVAVATPGLRHRITFELH